MRKTRIQGFNRGSQRGYALFSSLVGLAIMAAIVTTGARLADRHILNKRAEIEGEAMGQFAIGLRSLVAHAQSTPSMLPGGTQMGVNWLKAPTCGGLAMNPEEGYVPCSFSGQSFSGSFATTFSRNGATNEIVVRTTFSVAQQGYSRNDAMLMADRLVATALSQQSLPNNGMFYTAFANVPQTASAPASGASRFDPGADAGRVVMVVNNAPSHDIWLRTDGTNKMLANINMNDFSIAQAKDGRFKGKLQIDEALITHEDSVVDFRGDVMAPDISLTNIGEWASEGIYNAIVLEGGSSYSVAKPDCSKVGNNPGIYVAMQTTGGVSPTGDALYAAGATVTNNGSTWGVYPNATGVKFDLERAGLDIRLTKQVVSSAPTDMRLIALTRCR